MLSSISSIIWCLPEKNGVLPLSFVNILDENFFSPAISGLLFSQSIVCFAFHSVNLLENINRISLKLMNKLKSVSCRDSVREMSLKVNSLSSHCDGTGKNRVAI